MGQILHGSATTTHAGARSPYLAMPPAQLLKKLSNDHTCRPRATQVERRHSRGACPVQRRKARVK